MTKKKWTGLLTTGVFSAVLFAGGIAPQATAEELQTLYDTGLNYTEQTGYDLNYCDCGYTGTRWIRATPGQVWTTGDISSYTLLLIGIGAYSSGFNDTGKDYPLDDAFFEGLRTTLESARTNGTNVGLRLRYDDNGTNNPEPESFDMVLQHIQALGDSGLLTDYADVISFVETGMVGAWGEQWGGKYTSLEYKAQVLDAFLNITPDNVSVSVRTPNTVREWLSTYCGVKTTAADMRYEISDPELAAKAKRIGLYNDGYMGSNSDLGTYSDRAGETAWLATAATYGGEFSGADEFRIGYDTWQPQNALPEMYATHLMRINGNLYRDRTESQSFASKEAAQQRLQEIDALYEKMGLGWYDEAGTVTEKDGAYVAQWKWMGYDAFIFDESLDNALGVSCDNRAFYGETVWQFMRAHLGYRYVLRQAAMNREAEPGGTLALNFAVENTGFANAPREKEVEVLLSNGQTLYTMPTTLNAQTWASGTKTEESLTLPLPETMSGGTWKVYLRISNCNEDPLDDAKYSCRFANEDLVYEESLGANYIGSISISGAADAPAAEVTDKRPAGYYPASSTPLPIDEETQTKLLDMPYTFTESDHYGFTFLYKVTGIQEPIQLGNWYLSFADGTTNYSSAYTTYGLNTRNQELTEDGYYLLGIPFYGCVFNFPEASTAGSTILKELNINDSRNYWSADTFTKINGNQQVTLQPIGFAEGMPSGYDVTFHIGDQAYTYTGAYALKDVKSQTIQNLPAVTVLSLLDQPYETDYVGADGNTYTFAGFTTKPGDKRGLITADSIAIGTMELYPYYEVDLEKTNFNATTETLTAAQDAQSIHYLLDDTTMTAAVGDGSDWENNSGCHATGQLLIPAAVQTADGKRYTVTKISDRAFSGNTGISDVILPDTITAIGADAFWQQTTLHVYEGGTPAQLLADTAYQVVQMPSSIQIGDVDRSGTVTLADGILLQSWLVGQPAVLDQKAADCNGDGQIDIYDLACLKRMLHSV